MNGSVGQCGDVVNFDRVHVNARCRCNRRKKRLLLIFVEFFHADAQPDIHHDAGGSGFQQNT
tara:strand:- start:7174 stop:7359 length:186 start_codon:yes stop_codon:yes gene_type:complete